MSATYAEFLARKAQLDGDHGFHVDPDSLHDSLFDFQRSLTSWALKKGRSALLCDTGTGKTIMELVWADRVSAHTGKPVLILTPLAVGPQFVREAERFCIDAARSVGGEITAPIVVTNYERLHHFTASDFAGVVCDESAILKSFEGETRKQITDFMRKLPYRLLATATPSPNDFPELGTSSEALGYLGYMDMLARFFTNNERTSKMFVGRWRRHGDEGWRFKGHAEQPFWRWVSSWARAMRKPSDLGFSDNGFDLPPLVERDHIVSARTIKPGMLFNLPAKGFHEEREERRRTIDERCEMAASLTRDHDYSLVFCHLNDEGNLLERLIPGSIQVAGNDPHERKEAAVEWFVGSRCICQDPLFRDKLAAWHTILSTNGNTTKHAENNGLPNPLNTSASTKRSGGNTCATTTPQTKQRSGQSGLLSNGQQSMLPGENGTPRIASFENSTSPKSPSGNKTIPTSDSTNASASSASPQPSTMPSSNGKAAAAPYADEPNPTDSDDDSVSITATIPAEFAGFFAAPVILESANSRMTPIGSNGQPCICGHLSGHRVLITKPTILGYGLNFQHCAHIVTFASHSFEQTYQSIRRCHRYGQTRPVVVDTVMTEGEEGVRANLARKAEQADRMFASLVEHMNEAMGIRRLASFDTTMEVPSWLAS